MLIFIIVDVLYLLRICVVNKYTYMACIHGYVLFTLPLSRFYNGPSVKVHIKYFFYFHDWSLGGENENHFYFHNRF